MWVWVVWVFFSIVIWMYGFKMWMATYLVDSTCMLMTMMTMTMIMMTITMLMIVSAGGGEWTGWTPLTWTSSGSIRPPSSLTKRRWIVDINETLCWTQTTFHRVGILNLCCLCKPYFNVDRYFIPVILVADVFAQYINCRQKVTWTLSLQFWNCDLFKRHQHIWCL